MKAPRLFLLCSLGLGSLAHGASVFLVAEGIINQSSSGAYPLVAAGDVFRLTVSYSDYFADTDTDPNLGVYLPTDLRMVLEIIGKGVAFQSVGGSVSVSVRPGDFPVYSIFSQSQPNGHSLALFFAEANRSHAPLSGDRIPSDFGQYSDYDSVGFSIINFPDPYAMTPQQFPYIIPINPMDGSVTSFSVPEPSIAIITGLALALCAMRRRRFPVTTTLTL